MNNDRRNAILIIMSEVSDLIYQVADILNEEKESYHNIPQGLQHSEQTELSSEAIYKLEYAISSLKDSFNSLRESFK